MRMVTGGRKVTVNYADVARVSFTGRDMADGRSWEAWVKSTPSAKPPAKRTSNSSPK